MLTILQSYDSSYDDNSGSAAAGAIFGIGFLIFYIFIYIAVCFCWYKTFKKAGREDAWAAFIPFYNFIVLVQIIKKPTWWFILFFIPFVNLYALFIAGDKLAKGFGKGENSTIWGVIAIFTSLFVNMIVHAFGSDQFDSSAVPDETA
ncbi:signal peptidase I [Elizabethkingia anophelis]|nr:signal peptidase I [Elizabethkingia anophelis]